MKRQIGAGQLIAVLLCSRIIVTLNFSLGGDTKVLSLATCLGVLLAMPVTIIISLPGIAFSLKEKSSPVDCAYKICRPLGDVSAVLYALFFMYIAAITLMRFDAFSLSTMQSVELPVAFSALMLLPILYVAIKGIEPIARFAGVFVFIAFFAIVIIFLFLIPRMSSYNLVTPFYSGVSDLFKNAALIISNSVEPVMFMFLLKAANGVKYRHFLIFSGFAVLAIEIILLSIVAVLGDFNATQVFPYYTVSSSIGGAVIERLDALQTGVWTILALIKSAVCIYIAGTCLEKIVPKKLRTVMYIALVVLLGVGIAVLSGDFETLRVKLGIYFSVAVIAGATLFVPGILYAVFGIKNAVKSRSGDQ